jgi:DNA replication protein DnaC
MANPVLKIVERDEQKHERATFDDFWLLYPRRVARKDAERAWSRMNEAQRMAAVVALVDWRRVWQARGDVQYVPHASTWLNGERWTDELPAEFVQRTAHASHVIAKPPETERGEMPAHVREALERMRKR